MTARTPPTIVASLLLLLIASLPAEAQTSFRQGRTDIIETDRAEVTQIVRSMMRALRIDGATVIAVRDGRDLYRGYFGTMRPDTPVRVASASKWASGLVVASLAAEGRLPLEATLAQLGVAAPGLKGQITVAQLMSHTSGIDPESPVRERLRNDTLAESAAAALDDPLLDAPGQAFRYGGTSMQVAGWLVERATGGSFEAAFRARVADPLGLSPATTFGRGGNPLVGAGLDATPRDYERILAMVAARGLAADGRRVLPAGMFAAMERDWSEGTRNLGTPETAEAMAGYGIGLWCEEQAADLSCPRVSSPGGFGTYPYLDRRRNLYVLMMVEDRLPRVMPYWQRILTALTAAADGR